MANNKKNASRKNLSEEMKKQITALKTQCKDSAFFDSQIDKILSLKGQIDTEEVRLLVKEKDVLREYKGDVFYIAITNNGAMIHTYGGYTVFVSNRNYTSLYETLVYFVDELKDELKNAETEEERSNIETDMMAKLHVILAPTWCFSSIEATYNIATSVVHELNNMAEQLENMPLQEEDFERNNDFEKAVMTAESLKDKLEQERESDG